LRISVPKSALVSFSSRVGRGGFRSIFGAGSRSALGWGGCGFGADHWQAHGPGKQDFGHRSPAISRRLSAQSLGVSGLHLCGGCRRLGEAQKMNPHSTTLCDRGPKGHGLWSWFRPEHGAKSKKSLGRRLRVVGGRHRSGPVVAVPKLGRPAQIRRLKTLALVE